MPRCDFKKVARNFIEIALRHDCSPVNLLHIFRTTFLKNTSGWLLLNIILNILEYFDQIVQKQSSEGVL